MNKNIMNYTNNPHTMRIRGDPPPGIPIWRELLNLLAKIVAIVLIFILIFTFCYGFHQNTDPGMFPMIKSGDLAIFYRLDKDYAIGDLLMIEYNGERHIRRVVAKTGDIVDITEGWLSINGAIQAESEIYQQTWRYEDGIDFPLTLGKNQLFVLGDARENAMDSRIYGPVNTGHTVGKVITVIRRRNL